LRLPESSASSLCAAEVKRAGSPYERATSIAPSSDPSSRRAGVERRTLEAEDALLAAFFEDPGQPGLVQIEELLHPARISAGKVV